MCVSLNTSNYNTQIRSAILIAINCCYMATGGLKITFKLHAAVLCSGPCANKPYRTITPVANYSQLKLRRQLK